jgi:hypothetical protein
VVVVVGLAVTLAPVVAESPEEGVHTYVDAPVAVSPVELPAHIATFEPALMVGILLTDTE